MPDHEKTHHIATGFLDRTVILDNTAYAYPFVAHGNLMFIFRNPQ